MHDPIPTVEQCLQYMDDFSMYENIRRHSFMVARVANILLSGLEQNGSVTFRPNRDLVTAGALMHDIAKTKCLQEGCKHAEVGRQICIDLGLESVSRIVADHVVLSGFKENEYRQGWFSATELVFYADKRVNHDRVVSLDDRLTYIIDKYSNNEAVREDHIRRNFQQCREVEQHLFRLVGFSPDDINSLLETAPRNLAHYPPA